MFQNIYQMSQIFSIAHLRTDFQVFQETKVILPPERKWGTVRSGQIKAIRDGCSTMEWRTPWSTYLNVPPHQLPFLNTTNQMAFLKCKALYLIVSHCLETEFQVVLSAVMLPL